MYTSEPKGIRSSADADKPARGVKRSVKVTKHSTIPYIRYNFLLVWKNFIFKTRRFSDIRLQKCRDLNIRVIGPSRSLKMVPFNSFGMVSYQGRSQKLHVGGGLVLRGPNRTPICLPSPTVLPSPPPPLSFQNK